MTKYFKAIIIGFCFFVLSVTTPATAAEISVGLGGAWQSSPYKEHDDTLLPVPLIHFEGERFYVRGLNAGVHIWRNESHELSFGAAYSALSFDSGKTADRRLKRLDDRHPTLNAYLQYIVKTDYGHAGMRILRDVLDNSDAFSAEVYYTYPFMLGPVYVRPGAGIRWDSEDQLDYYFGISSSEARKSGLDRYSPDGGISPFLSLEADWSFADNWSVMAAGSVLFLNKEIKDSPMVDDSQTFNVTIGLKYTF